MLAQAPAVFDLDRLSIGYGGETVLDAVSLRIRQGERIAVMGRSGAGKSTLLNTLYSLAPQACALIPQAAALVRPLSVFANVYMGRLDQRSTLENLATLIRRRRADIEEIGAILAALGIADKIFEPAGNLSGGQQQRAAIARALYNGRPVLIGDEPVSALDRVRSRAVIDQIRGVHPTIILALHDITLALEFAERILVIDYGKIVLDAPARDIGAADLVPYYAG